MSDAVAAAFVAGALAAIPGIATVILSWRTHRRVALIKKDINGGLDKMLSIAEESGRQKGVLEERKRHEQWRK